MSRARTQLAGAGPAADPAVCELCCGEGWTGYDDFGHVVSCPGCDGLGRLRQAEAPPRVTYTATVLDEEIDGGCRLQDFVRQLAADWPHLDHDLAVWVTGEPDRGPRLVAVLHPGPGLRTVVRWL